MQTRIEDSRNVTAVNHDDLCFLPERKACCRVQSAVIFGGLSRPVKGAGTISFIAAFLEVYPFDFTIRNRSFSAAIGGLWRAEADETENYTYAIALQSKT